MRRLFSRKSESAEVSVKPAKEAAVKDNKPKKSLFKRKPVPQEQHKVSQLGTPPASNQGSTSSVASSVSMPPPRTEQFMGLPTPTGSNSSFTSVMSYTESPTPPSEVTSSLTSPTPSTLSRSAGSNTSISSMASGSGGMPMRSVSSPLSRPPSSSGYPERKPSSPLSVVTDVYNLPTPPPSPGKFDNDPHGAAHEDMLKRRTSIYNIFRRSQNNVNQASSAPSSRSNSTTTLPSTCTAPFMPPEDLVPPASPSPLPSRRTSVNFLRRKSVNLSVEDLGLAGDGMLSRNEATAHRAILMGDPLGGGGPYAYPGSALNKKPSTPQIAAPHGAPIPQPKRSNRPYDPSRRNSWGPSQANGGNGGAVWRAPHIGGRYGGKMTIEEENDMMDYQQQQPQGPPRRMSPVTYMEDTSYHGNQHHYPDPMGPRRPMSIISGGRRTPSGSSSHQMQRPAHYPPFAPPPIMPACLQSVSA